MSVSVRMYQIVTEIGPNLPFFCRRWVGMSHPLRPQPPSPTDRWARKHSAYRSGGSAMTKGTSSKRRTRRRHVREKATIDHLVRAVYSKADERGTTHPPVTASGLSVEEQVRKQWHPGLGGLALF